MVVFQILFLALAGKQVVQFRARPHVAAATYAIVFLIVAIIFGDAFFPALAARVTGGALAASWLWLLSRSTSWVFLVVAALCATIPFFEFGAFDFVADLLSPVA